MRRSRLLLPLVVVGLSACSIPFRSSSSEKKAPCDQIAARAIQTSSLDEAKTLAAQASECYAHATT